MTPTDDGLCRYIIISPPLPPRCHRPRDKAKVEVAVLVVEALVFGAVCQRGTEPRGGFISESRAKSSQNAQGDFVGIRTAAAPIPNSRPGPLFYEPYRRFFLASQTPIPAISSSVMNRMPALSNAT